MQNDLVSIVIPVFNNEDYIGETLDSILSQTYSSWEAICVDDGSTDSSCQIVENYSFKDNRIRLIRRDCPNKGGSVCRNIGLSNSSGEYVIFLDGDDKLTSTCLENRVQFISNSYYHFVVYPTVIFKDYTVFGEFTDRGIRDYKMAFASIHAAWQTSSPIYRTEFVKKLGGFDEKFQRLQDIEMGLRCITAAKGNFCSLIGKTEPDTLFRRGDGQTKVKKYILAYKQYYAFFKLVDDLSKEADFLNRRKLSWVHLCMGLSAYIVYLQANRSSEINLKDLFDSVKLYDKLMIVEKVLLKSVSLFSAAPKLQFYYVLFVRKTIMRLFF